jgi:ubiquinone/menaquinone biosynthesis C-methylase UbiE
MINYDDLAAEYARNRRLHPRVFEHLRRAIRAESRVLEVGCGTGNYISALQESSGCAAWGIDPSAEMLARAQARSVQVCFQPGRAERLDFAAGSLDFIYSVDVIHHVRDHAAHFAESYRALAEGGRVCTVTDSEEIIRRREPLSVYFPESVEVELRRYPPISRLCGWMAEAGFVEISEEMVEFAYDLSDIQPYRDRAFSSLHLISEKAFQRGLTRLEADLAREAIPCVSRYLLLWGSKPGGAHG